MTDRETRAYRFLNALNFHQEAEGAMAAVEMLLAFADSEALLAERATPEPDMSDPAARLRLLREVAETLPTEGPLRHFARTRIIRGIDDYELTLQPSRLGARCPECAFVLPHVEPAASLSPLYCPTCGGQMIYTVFGESVSDGTGEP